MRQPLLVAFKGFLGCGKSTVSRELCSRLGWPLIDKDDLKDLLDGRSSEAGLLSYQLMVHVARRQLLLGLNVICDSPLTYASIYRLERTAASQAGGSMAVIECLCSDEAVWRRRIDGRKELNLPSHHQTDWQVMQASTR